MQEIAWSAGFENVSHFRRQFAAQIGVLPGALRAATAAARLTVPPPALRGARAAEARRWH